MSRNKYISDSSSDSKNFAGQVIKWVVRVIILLVLLAPILLYSYWVGAFVVTKLWAWYVVPTFGVFQLSLIQAFGILLLLRFAAWQGQGNEPKPEDTRTKGEKAAGLLFVFLCPWIVLLIGWLGKVFFM